MRLFLLPISTRRTLLYCERNIEPTGEKRTVIDKAQERAARLWASWEAKDSGWQRKIIDYGNHALKRIPYEEWGLKSVPPLSKKRRDGETTGITKVEVIYPKTLMPMDRVPGVLQALSTEREALHKKKLIWCFIGMPISAPFALVPVIPNIPFFYLVYRAWSHWRALAGGRHIQFLLQNKLLSLTPSPILDEVYAKQKWPLPSSTEPTTDTDAEPVKPSDTADFPNHDGETMLLSQANGKGMTQALDLPQLEVELERAIWQVETAIKKQSAEEAQKFSAATPSKKPADDAAKPDDKKSQ